MKSFRLSIFVLVFLVAFTGLRAVTHAAFSYTSAPHTTVSGTAAPYNHSVELNIKSSDAVQNVIVVITPMGTTNSIGSYPINFQPGINQLITYNQLLANTVYKVQITQTVGAASNGLVVLQTLEGFHTLVDPNQQTTTVQTTPPPVQTTSSSTTTTTTTPQTTTTTTTVSGADQCHDGIDNNNDGKADQYGVYSDQGILMIEPDPSCFVNGATTEENDDVVSEIIPCTNKCTFSDVFKLLNNAITFFFTKLLAPIFVIMIMYAGFRYITAEGNPAKTIKLKSMLWHIIKGLLYILCAWLVVYTIMTTVLNDDFKQQGVEFLGQ